MTNELKAEAARVAAKALQKSRITLDIGLASSAGVTNLKRQLTPGRNQSWTVLKVREYALAYASGVVEQQIARQNPPSVIMYDGSPFGDPETFTKSITVLFQGGTDVRPIMEQLKREVASAIPGTRWTWIFQSADASRRVKMSRLVNGTGPINLLFTDRVIYAPVRFYQTNPDPTYANIQKVSGKRRKAGATKSGRPRKQSGNYGLIAKRMRRATKAKGIYVKAYHTIRYARNIGRSLPPGVKVGDRVGDKYYQGAWGFVIRLSLGSARSRR